MCTNSLALGVCGVVLYSEFYFGNIAEHEDRPLFINIAEMED